MTPSPLDMPKNLHDLPSRIGGFVVSRHARERMEEMDLTADRVAWVLEDPDDSWSQEETYGPHKWAHARGNYGIITAKHPGVEPVIVTVVWRSRKVWEQRRRMGYTR